MPATSTLYLVGYSKYRFRVLSELGRSEFRGYLARSPVLSELSRVLGEWTRLLRAEGLPYNQPFYVLLQSPPGTGKTYLAATLLEAVRRDGRALTFDVSMALYLAPYRPILYEVARLLGEVSGGAWRRERSPAFYLLYETPSECPIAKKYFAEYMRLAGYPTIACFMCPYGPRGRTRFRAQETRMLLRRLAERGYTVHDAPVIRVVPEEEGRPCLRRLASVLTLLYPSTRSRRSYGIAGLLGTYGSMINSVYLLAWANQNPSGTPKMLILDEVDTLLLSEVIDVIELRGDLSGKEREVLAAHGLLGWYKQLLELVAMLADQGDSMTYGEKLIALREHLKRVDPLVLERAARACRDAVINEMEECRLYLPLVQLALLSRFTGILERDGCLVPLHEIALAKPECLMKMTYVDFEASGRLAVIKVRPVGLVVRLLTDPNYPAYNHKILMSATLDYLIKMSVEENIEHRLGGAGGGGHEALGVYVSVRNRYRGLRLVLIEPTPDMLEALKLYQAEVSGLADSVVGLLGAAPSQPMGLEFYILQNAPEMLKAVLGAAHRYAGGRGRHPSLLLFTNSKSNAERAAGLVARFYAEAGAPARTVRTSDFIMVDAGGSTVYISWYRSRVSRGVSLFKSMDASACLVYAREPGSKLGEVASRYRMAATTIQSLWRIVRSPSAHGKVIIMPEYVHKFLERNGPVWYHNAFDDIIRVDGSTAAAYLDYVLRAHA